MKTVWYIARKDLLQAFKDKGAFILLLIVPLALITVVGLAFGNAFGTSSSQISIDVAISNRDNGFVGSAIVSALKINTPQLVIHIHQYNDPASVTQQVANSNVNAGVIIPAGTSNALTVDAQNGTPPHNLVKFYSLPSNNDARITITQQIVSSVMSQLAAGSAGVSQVYRVCNQPGNHCAPGTLNSAIISASIAQASGIAAQQAVEALNAGQAPHIGQFDQILPGYAIFFALFSINAAAATILQEKEDGTFRRLLIAPVQKYALLGGKLLAQFLLTLIQLAILFGIGYLVFHIHIGNWPAVIALLIGASFAATGLGILLVSLVKTRRQLAPVVTLVTLITSAIGGAWWPLFIEPTWMQQIAKIGLTAWAMEGLNNVMLFGKGFSGALPDILGLFVYGLICFLIAMRFFRFQEKVA